MTLRRHCRTYTRHMVMWNGRAQFHTCKVVHINHQSHGHITSAVPPGCMQLSACRLLAFVAWMECSDILGNAWTGAPGPSRCIMSAYPRGDQSNVGMNVSHTGCYSNLKQPSIYVPHGGKQCWVPGSELAQAKALAPIATGQRCRSRYIRSGPHKQ